MSITLRYTPPQGEPHITLPRSKSMAARAMIMRAVAGEYHSSATDDDCDDIQVLDKALTLLEQAKGAQVEIDVQASGTALRLLTAYAAATPGVHADITGISRLRQRPLATLVETLRSLGADIEYRAAAGFAPVRIHGRKLKGGHASVDARMSSQFATALLLVAETMEKPLDLEILNLNTSAPYVALTKAMLRRGAECPIEPDWSAAAFIYEYMAVSGITAHFDGDKSADTSLQGDSAAKELFQKAIDGAARIAMEDTPDIVPPLLAAITALHLDCTLTGTENLKYKESDRLAAMVEELEKIKGRTAGSRIKINAHGDHRIAMAMAMTLPALPGCLMEIDDPDVVNKSFPRFWEEVEKLGITRVEP